MMMNKRYLLAATIVALSTVLILGGVMNEAYAWGRDDGPQDNHGGG